MGHNRFIFATGIENSYPTIVLPDGTTQRVDELEKAKHYQYWKEDFRLVKEIGIEFLRYGPPIFSTYTAPGQYNWSFTDEVFAEMKSLGIQPIVDLCHFGVPDWIGNFQNPDFPKYFEEYARAFARRFPYLRFYTPVNEIFIAAMFSGQYGWWNERLTTDKGFVTALKNLCKANTLAIHAILQVQPNAVFIQSESTEYFHAEMPTSICRETADFLNEKRFLSLDLTYGHAVSSIMYNYLLDNEMTRKEYEWFMQNAHTKNSVMGNDYYVTNEHMVYHNGSTGPSGDIFGYYAITKQYFDRYRLPVMHTETNMVEPDAAAWLRRQWANAYRLKQDGVPLIGFTWYSLTDQVDWDTALRESNGNVNKLGLYDLDRKIRPVGEVYKKMVEIWKPLLSADCYGLHMENYE